MTEALFGAAGKSGSEDQDNMAKSVGKDFCKGNVTHM